MYAVVEQPFPINDRRWHSKIKKTSTFPHQTLWYLAASSTIESHCSATRKTLCSSITVTIDGGCSSKIVKLQHFQFVVFDPPSPLSHSSTMTDRQIFARLWQILLFQKKSIVYFIGIFLCRQLLVYFKLVFF